MSLEKMTLAAEGSELQLSTSEAKFRSLPQQWAYIGRLPLDGGCIQGGGWVAADIRVTRGSVGVGVLDRSGDFLTSGSAKASDDVQTIFLPIDKFAATGDLILRNWDENSSSEGVLEAVRIAAKDGQTPTACDSGSTRARALVHARSLSLEKMMLAADGSDLQVSASGVRFSSISGPWAYIARLPLVAGCLQDGGWVVADIRVTRGRVGVGVLNRKGDEFLASASTKNNTDLETLLLPLD